MEAGRFPPLPASSTPAEAQTRTTISPRQAAGGSGLFPEDHTIRSQHLSCVAWLQLAHNRQFTVTKVLLEFINRKNKDQGSFYLRNGREAGKHQ